MTRRKQFGDAHYFAFGAKDWRSSESVALMCLAEKGAFVDLLSIAWLSSDEPCSIPATDAEIAALLRIPVDEWKVLAPRVLAEFDETTKGGRLRNERLWNEWKRMLSARRQMAKGGRTSALRRRDEHGRLLPSSDQAPSKLTTKHPSKVLSGNQNQNQNQSTTTTKTTTSADKPPRVTPWLLPASRVWEARFGAGTFPWGKAGRHLKPLHSAGHEPPAIADHLGRYLRGTETQFVSLPRFADTYASYAPVDANALVDEFGVLTALGDRETRPVGRVA